MATVYYTLIPGTPLTEEQKKRLEELKDFEDPMDDPDCPPDTEEDFERAIYLMSKYNTRIITKEMILEYEKMKAEGTL